MVTAVCIGCLAAVAACGGSAKPTAVAVNAPVITIVVSAPASTEPWVSTFMKDGAELAADEVNSKGGVKVGTSRDRIVVKVLDNAGSPTTAAADARQAVADKAAALIIDGVGANAVSAIATPADLPVFVVFDGGADIINAKKYPTTYRVAPADQPMAQRLADYLASSHPKIGLINDTTDYGIEGAAASKTAFASDKTPVVSHSTIPADASDAAAEVLAAKHAGATLLTVWASSSIVASVISDARQAGWDVPIWTGPTGEDPLVRQRLAAHPQWLTGVGFVSFRITAEVGPPPYIAFRAAFTKQFGTQPIGVKQDGKPVIEPPDWAMFPFDSVKLIAAALPQAGAIGAPLQHQINGKTVITGANGDERGFTPSIHEGVSPEDMYFATFHGFVFSPVTNDPLSLQLPAVTQLG